MITDGKEFWKRVDECNPYKTLGELYEKGNLSKDNMKQQRTDMRLPKTIDVFKLSKAIGKPMEYLLSGEDTKRYPPRIERIASYLMHFATEEDFILIERILRIPGKNNTVSTELLG